MASQAHKSVSKGDIQAVLSLLTLLRHMTVMNRQFETLLFSCQPSIKAQFAAIVNTLQDTVSLSFIYLLIHCFVIVINLKIFYPALLFHSLLNILFV